MKVTLKYKIGNQAPILIYALHSLVSLRYVDDQDLGLHAEVIYDIPDHDAPDVVHTTKEWWETLIVHFNEKNELVCNALPLVDHLEEKLRGTFKFYSPNLIPEGEKYGSN